MSLPIIRLPDVTVATILATAGIMCLWCWPFVCNDMQIYLIPWFDHIRGAGPIAAFAQPFSDYTPPYLYGLAVATLGAGIAAPMTLIKLLSLVCTGALVAAVWRLLNALGAQQPGRQAVILFALPSVVLNAALLGQCDALWAAACVMALAAAVRRHHRAMLGWVGLAIAIKLQAVFVVPLILALLIGRRVPLRRWLYAPLAFAAAMLPAWLAGWPMLDLATIYLHQAGSYSALSLNAPNIWAIAQALPWIGQLPLTGLAMAAGLGAAAALTARFVGRTPSGDQVIAAALLVVLVMAGLLPHMHERYFFLADILSVSLALVRRDRTSWQVAALVQAGSLLGLSAYLVGIDGFAIIGALPMLAATLLVARPFLASPANDNGLPLNPLTIYPA
jgi:Gpi18-like mannosyltransferase